MQRIWGFVSDMISMYGKGSRSVPTLVREPTAIQLPTFTGREYEDMNFDIITRAYRENNLHLKSKRAEVYSQICTQWLNQPLAVDQVYENRGFLILERALRTPISEAETAGMQLYLMFAASIGLAVYHEELEDTRPRMKSAYDGTMQEEL